MAESIDEVWTRRAVFHWIFKLGEKLPQDIHRLREDPPGDYRIQRRIGKARRLLLHYGRQVKEVALRLGYSSPAAFGAQFLAVTGMTPQQFRLHHDIG